MTGGLEDFDLFMVMPHVMGLLERQAAWASSCCIRLEIGIFVQYRATFGTETSNLTYAPERLSMEKVEDAPFSWTASAN